MAYLDVLSGAALLLSHVITPKVLAASEGVGPTLAMEPHFQVVSPQVFAALEGVGPPLEVTPPLEVICQNP